MSKGISRLNRNFDDYKKALIELSKTYYPDMATNFEDASVAAWMIDLMASLADNESYHIDRAYQETNINDAQQRSSLLAIARNNGIKVPGPKGSMAEVEISCIVPFVVYEESNNGYSLPVLKRGTVFSSANQKFELLYDVDFGSQYDYYNESDRTITHPTESTTKLTKLAVVVAGETMVESFKIGEGDSKPFMELIIPNTKVMNIESVIETKSNDTNVNPSYEDFYSNCPEQENGGITRYYEVESFIQTEIWDDVFENNKPVIYTGTNGEYHVTKGEWKPVDHKFITEYTDNGNLKIIFGAGNGHANAGLGEGMAEFSKWQISRIINNNNLGVLPKEGNMIYVLYRSGGGSASNVAAGAINRISKLKLWWPASTNKISPSVKSSIESSLRVTNLYPSVSGKDAPSEEELRYLIKYNNSAQERCVTTKDYAVKILQMPPKYGTPFRVGVEEMNNKIMINLLGIDYEGHLSYEIPLAISKNIENYLSHYKMVNDYIEIKAGRVINLAFDIKVFYDKAHDYTEIEDLIRNKVKKFMDINNHSMGENLYISELEKEIWSIDGIKNIADFRVFNRSSISTDSQRKYSAFIISQDSDPKLADGYEDREVELYSTRTVYCDGNTMFELKYPEDDIKITLEAV